MDPPWPTRAIDERTALRLASELDVLPTTARCLIARGYEDPSRAGAFLHPRLVDLRPPVGMAGFERAVARLVDAVRAGDTVGIFGDYDVDGVTAAALLTTFLSGVGARVETRVASRDRGYGFGEVDARDLVGRGARLVVTVDCGTSDLDAIAACRAANVDVIVVDHHQVPKGSEHPAIALLNPHRADSTYPFRGLASVGLCFFLAAACRTTLKAAGWFGARKEPDVRELLDLVAVGTVADMAPLGDENRILVAAGLRELAARRRPGLRALLESAGVDRDRPVSETDIGWKLGPRLNAPGRLGGAEPALALLLAKDDREAYMQAGVLEDANTYRRELTARITEEALAEAAEYAGEAALVVARAGWHPGVAGIVAARLVDRYAKPAIVIAVDERSGEGRGSVRTAGGVNVYDALCDCRAQLVRFGGHAQAAGVTVAAGQIEPLRRAFADAVARRPMSPTRMTVDAVVPLGDVSERLAVEMRALAPFGQGNAAPILATGNARVVSTRRVGGDGAHLKMVLECGRARTEHSAIAFHMGDEEPGIGSTVDLAFCPELNQFRGEKRVELRVLSMFRHGGAA